MDLLKTLTEFLTEEYGGKALSSVMKILSDNDYDVKRAVNSLRPETLLPLLKKFIKTPAFGAAMASAFSNKESPPKSELYLKLSPVENIADAKILKSLNSYLGEE